MWVNASECVYPHLLFFLQNIKKNPNFALSNSAAYPPTDKDRP